MSEWLPVIVAVGAAIISFANLLFSRRDRTEGEARLKGILEERDRQRDRELGELRRRFEQTETYVLHERLTQAQRAIETIHAEMGGHDSGIRGRLHKVENTAQAHEMRLATIERQRRGER